ncbi:MAG: hypothetical protein ACREXR_06025 [Gammaproteobacteria bacterium]
MAPTHPGTLHALGRKRLAGGLDHTGADGQVFLGRLGVTHAVAMPTEITEDLGDAPSAWICPVQVHKRPDDFGDAIAALPQEVVVLLELGPAFGLCSP